MKALKINKQDSCQMIKELSKSDFLIIGTALVIFGFVINITCFYLFF